MDNMPIVVFSLSDVFRIFFLLSLFSILFFSYCCNHLTQKKKKSNQLTNTPGDNLDSVTRVNFGACLRKIRLPCPAHGRLKWITSTSDEDGPSCRTIDNLSSAYRSCACYLYRRWNITPVPVFYRPTFINRDITSSDLHTFPDLYKQSFSATVRKS